MGHGRSVSLQAPYIKLNPNGVKIILTMFTSVPILTLSTSDIPSKRWGEPTIDKDHNLMSKLFAFEHVFDRTVSFFLVSLGVVLAGATALTGA